MAQHISLPLNQVELLDDFSHYTRDSERSLQRQRWPSSQAGYVRAGVWERSHPLDSRPRQVWGHLCRCAAARWDPRQSHAGQKRLVLVVSEIRSQEYRISEAREECTRDEERLMGGSNSYPAVAVEKENPLRPPMGGGRGIDGN